MLCKVIENREIAEGIFSLVFEMEKQVEGNVCGKFFNIKCSPDTYLRRPLSICDVDGKNIKIVYRAQGEGTTKLSKVEKQEMIDVLGPLGNGFQDLNYKNVAIVGGGIGIPPLLLTAKQFQNPKMFLGYKNKETSFLIEEFEKLGEVFVNTDDGSLGDEGHCVLGFEKYIKDNHIEMVYACGPYVMLECLYHACEKSGIDCYFSLEERMACGIGACLVCVCATNKENGDLDYKRVCKDGPVFKGKDLHVLRG